MPVCILTSVFQLYNFSAFLSSSYITVQVVLLDVGDVSMCLEKSISAIYLFCLITFQLYNLFGYLSTEATRGGSSFDLRLLVGGMLYIDPGDRILPPW